MKRQMLSGFALAFVTLAILAFRPSLRAGSAGQDPRNGVDAFNREFIGACQSMDHSAAAALWADDGVDLLPGIAPMIGKAKISEWLNGLTPRLAGGKIAHCTVDWKDVQIQGDLAYEWGINRQKIEFPPPQQPIGGEGKILLILKRQADGSWKIVLESWNSNPQSEQKP